MGNTYPNLTFQQLQSKLNKKENVKIIDIRTAKSFERGHIKGAINIPYTSWSSIPKITKDEEVVVICYVGTVSPKASERLAELHNNVYSFKGGMAQWQGEIESEKIGSKWSTGRLYSIILASLLLLTLPIAFIHPWWGIGYAMLMALALLMFGITNNNLITKIIRSFGYK